MSEVTDNEGLTLVPPAKKRKSPERFGAVTVVDLERLKELMGKDEPIDVEILLALDRLILRAQIAEANAAKDRKKAKADTYRGPG